MTAYRYHISADSLAVDTADTLGFCMEVERGVNWTNCVGGEVIPDPKEDAAAGTRLDLSQCWSDPAYQGHCHEGVWDVSKCLEYVPFSLSLPHFYRAPQYLRDAIVGLSEPKDLTDDTFFDVEPITGTVLRYRKRIQVSLMSLILESFEVRAFCLL